MPTPLEKYAQVILHSGCAIPPKGEQEPRKHRWDECRIQKFFLRVARKHQHKLQSNGLTIGTWVTEEKLGKYLDLELHIDEKHGFPAGYKGKDLAKLLIHWLTLS